MEVCAPTCDAQRKKTSPHASAQQLEHKGALCPLCSQSFQEEKVDLQLKMALKLSEEEKERQVGESMEQEKEETKQVEKKEEESRKKVFQTTPLLPAAPTQPDFCAPTSPHASAQQLEHKGAPDWRRGAEELQGQARPKEPSRRWTRPQHQAEPIPCSHWLSISPRVILEHPILIGEL